MKNDVIASLEEEYEGKKEAENKSPFETIAELDEFTNSVPNVS